MPSSIRRRWRWLTKRRVGPLVDLRMLDERNGVTGERFDLVEDALRERIEGATSCGRSAAAGDDLAAGIEADVWREWAAPGQLLPKYAAAAASAFPILPLTAAIPLSAHIEHVTDLRLGLAPSISALTTGAITSPGDSDPERDFLDMSPENLDMPSSPTDFGLFLPSRVWASICDSAAPSTRQGTLRDLLGSSAKRTSP
jgi:hypothetical protein